MFNMYLTDFFVKEKCRFLLSFRYVISNDFTFFDVQKSKTISNYWRLSCEL